MLEQETHVLDSDEALPVGTRLEFRQQARSTDLVMVESYVIDAFVPGDGAHASWSGTRWEAGPSRWTIVPPTDPPTGPELSNQGNSLGTSVNFRWVK